MGLMEVLKEYEGMTSQQREDLITTVAIGGVVGVEVILQAYNLLNGRPIDTTEIIAGIGVVATLNGVNITQLAGYLGGKR